MIKFIALSLIMTAILSAACPHDEYCVTCDGFKCTYCVNTYPDASGVCQLPTTVIDQCFSYSNINTCEECYRGYHLANNTCTKITIEDCMVLNSEDTTKCGVCDNGLLPKNGVCKDGDDCSLDNCDLCANATTCLKCEKAYAVNLTGKCVKDPIDNCDITDGTTCIVCSHKYYQSDNKCEKTDVQDSSLITSALMSLFVLLKLVF